MYLELSPISVDINFLVLLVGTPRAKDGCRNRYFDVSEMEFLQKEILEQPAENSVVLRYRFDSVIVSAGVSIPQPLS